uniref:Secreted protein n=1 Tax=Ditylenchus dipsaci TaxID=166011 RepID=A0A915DIZ4_9BILA
MSAPVPEGCRLGFVTAIFSVLDSLFVSHATCAAISTGNKEEELYFVCPSRKNTTSRNKCVLSKLIGGTMERNGRYLCFNTG